MMALSNFKERISSRWGKRVSVLGLSLVFASLTFTLAQGHIVPPEKLHPAASST